MTRYPCPYLGDEVELSDERERHIAVTTPICSQITRIESATHWQTRIRFAGVSTLGMHAFLQSGMMI